MGRKRTRHIIILRGLPGSGKSTRARTELGDVAVDRAVSYQPCAPGRERDILKEYGSGEAFSTDDYFRENGKMVGFHKKYLQEAHEWNRNRVLQAIRGKVHPIVIDNINLQKWEMWPYVRMAFRRGYWIEFEDLPAIPLEILDRRCPQIPMEVLERMNEGYEPVKKIWDVIYDYKSKERWMPNPERLQNHW
ncbi:NEDD4-binding protein 2-like 1 isoform X1 [Salvelinus fontinalis]|uniref:NEDD4-binding protein 2-like 1 isoform X1 n=1 Tax=Salvelinus fontinalis TaxID=8038 RepID=UPI0024851F33|nr:NEDD4-binding protein 2-like 1 isoform X1 [Salvelinus fontinalis]